MSTDGTDRLRTVVSPAATAALFGRFAARDGSRGEARRIVLIGVHEAHGSVAFRRRDGDVRVVQVSVASHDARRRTGNHRYLAVLELLRLLMLIDELEVELGDFALGRAEDATCVVRGAPELRRIKHVSRTVLLASLEVNLLQVLLIVVVRDG